MAEKDESEHDGIDGLETDAYGHEGEEEDELYEDIAIDEGGGAPEGDDGGKGKGKGVAARYLLPDIPADVTEEDIIDYFGAIGEVKQATVRQLHGGQVMGSVKFLNPSLEIKNRMLQARHKINGFPINVQTWKMQKLNRPGYKASIGKGAMSAGAMKRAVGFAGYHRDDGGAMSAGAMKRAVGFAGYHRDDGGEFVGRHGYEPRGERHGKGLRRGFGLHEEYQGRHGDDLDDIDRFGGFFDRREYGDGYGGRYGGASRGLGGRGGEGPMSMRSRGIGIRSGHGPMMREAYEDTGMSGRGSRRGFDVGYNPRGRSLDRYDDGYPESRRGFSRLPRGGGTRPYDDEDFEVLSRRARPMHGHSRLGEAGLLLRGERGPYGDGRPGPAPRPGGERRGGYMDSIKSGRGIGDDRRRYGGDDVEPARPGAFRYGRVPPGFDDVGPMPRGGKRGYGYPPMDDVDVGPYERPYNSHHPADFSPGLDKEYSMSAGKKGKEDEKDITARYLLSDLTADVTEDQLQDYFSAFGEIEDVTLRHLDSGKVVGSVKYLNPTFELRNLMLRESHEVNGCNITVQTWKMQKLQKPNYGKGAGSRLQKDREQRPEGSLRFRPY